MNAFSIHGALPTTSTQIVSDTSTKIPSPGSLAATDEILQAPISTSDRLHRDIPPATLTSTSTLDFIIYESSAQPTLWQSTNGYDVNQLVTKNSQLESEMFRLRLRNKELEAVNQNMRNREDELVKRVTEMSKQLTDLMHLRKQE